jgi:predicted DNA-binding transcriptional regulator AlpA
MKRLVYRTKEVAALLGVSINRIEVLAMEDKLPGMICLGSKILWHKSTIDFWVREYREPLKQLKALRRLIG